VPNASKVAEVEAIKGYLTDSVAALLTEYRGLKVKEMGELRDSLRNSSTDYRVLKNTLTGIAIDQVGYKDLLPMLDGPTAMAFVHGDPVQAAKDLAEFARTHPALVLKGGVLDGKVLDAASVRQLATLESREVMLARLAGMFQASLQRTAVLISAPLRQVATMTAALRDQREQSEGPTAAAADAGQGESAQAGQSAQAGESAEAAQAEPPPEAAAGSDEQSGTGEAG
jgi:large subunit ribosomal protein L10